MEVSILAKIQHPNVVTLVGVCVEGDHRLAVFGLCPGGSLRGALNAGRRMKGLLAASQSQPEHIHRAPFGRTTVLEWPERVQIAYGAARGLAYLHEVWLSLALQPNLCCVSKLLDVHSVSFGSGVPLPPPVLLTFASWRRTG